VLGAFVGHPAAVVVAASIHGVEGLRGWLSHCLQWRIGWGWWAIAALLPLAVMLLVAGLHTALGGNPLLRPTLPWQGWPHGLLI